MEQLQRYDRSPKPSPLVKGGRTARTVWAEAGDSHTALQEIRGGGIGRESLWQELKGQIYLGDERFIKRLQSRLKSKESEDINIPRAQRRGPAPSLELIGTRHEDRNEAVVAAYETGEYSYEQIGKHFGVHFTTVGRLVRAARKIGKKM
jgi:hypothetical protein